MNFEEKKRAQYRALRNLNKKTSIFELFSRVHAQIKGIDKKWADIHWQEEQLKGWE